MAGSKDIFLKTLLRNAVGVVPNACYLNTNPKSCTFMKPNVYYQNTKYIEAQMNPKELNIFALYVAHEASKKLCDCVSLRKMYNK